MRLTDDEKKAFKIPKDWRDPTYKLHPDDAPLHVPKPKRYPMNKYKWLVGVVLVALFILASADDMQVAESDAQYYEDKVEAGIWPE